MGFEHDIFISYAHDDNSTHQDDKRNWVSLLEHYLRARARGRGNELRIFRDVQLGHFTGVNDQLANLIANSAIFVSVVSPNYAKSKWCLWELEQMIQRGGLDRVLRIGKYPLDDSELTPQQRALLRQTEGLLEARFYDANESTKSVADLQPELFPEHLTEFYKRVNPLVDNIIVRLKELRTAHVPPPSMATPARSPIKVPGENQIAVYLAETTKDLAKERELVRSELVQFNYCVLPDQPLPQDADQLREAVRGHLQKAKLSVHLVGASYGTILDGEDASIPHIQFDLAAEMSKQSQINQVVWLPPELTPKGEQEKFVANLKNTSPDYVQAKLEDLKTIIRKKLQPDVANGLNEEEGEMVNVCLFYHERDKDSVAPLYSHLKIKEAFNVKLPLKDAQSFQNHKHLLQISDAILLYYGNGDDEWFGNLWRQIDRHTSTGRTKPVLAKAIYTGNPPTDEKEMLVSDDPVIIKNFGKFNEELLAPFIEKIKAAKGGLR